MYSISPENSKWTLCEKTAWVSSGVFGFGPAIMAFGLDRFKKNAAKASRGYEFVLERLFPTLQTHATNADSFKEKARKVAEVAKSKASTPIITARPQPS